MTDHMERQNNIAESTVFIEMADGRTGTGVMLPGGLMLTNWHVLETVEFAQQSRAVFGFKYDDSNVESRPLQPRTFFHTKKELDYTVVAVPPGHVNTFVLPTCSRQRSSGDIERVYFSCGSPGRSATPDGAGRPSSDR